MKASLQVRLSQHLALTPQLQQSIRLLQLSTLELHQEIEQMMEQNPFLEPEEDLPAHDSPFEAAGASASGAELSRNTADGEGDTRTTSESTSDGGEEPAGVDAAEFGTTERDDWENGTERDDFDGIRELPSSGSGQSGDNDDDFERQNRAGPGITLEEHLRTQLSSMRLSEEDAASVHVLIESLNEDGYLADPLEEIAERLAEVLGLVEPEERDACSAA